MMCPVGADVYYHVPGCLFRHVSGRRAYRPAERASGGSRPSVAGNTRAALTPPGLETFETSETESVVNKQQNVTVLVGCFILWFRDCGRGPGIEGLGRVGRERQTDREAES